MTTLTVEQLNDIKKRLDEHHQELREEIRQKLLQSDEEHYIDLAGNVHDAGEESVADMLADLDIATIDRQVNEIKQIEAARMRIATGNYGLCVDCEEEIDVARLQNTPYVERCVKCQSQYEKSPAYENISKL
jgi:DnaK suppressor protein